METVLPAQNMKDFTTVNSKVKFASQAQVKVAADNGVKLTPWQVTVATSDAEKKYYSALDRLNFGTLMQVKFPSVSQIGAPSQVQAQ